MTIFGWKLVHVSSDEYSSPDLVALELAVASLVEDVGNLRLQANRTEKKVYRDKPSQRFEPSDDGGEPQPQPAVAPAQPLQQLRSGDPPPPWMM